MTRRALRMRLGISSEVLQRGRVRGHVLMWDHDGRAPPKSWYRAAQRAWGLGPVHILRSSRGHYHAISYDVRPSVPEWWASAPAIDPLQAYYFDAHSRITLRMSPAPGKPRPRWIETLDAVPTVPQSRPHAAVYRALGAPAARDEAGLVGGEWRLEAYACGSCGR